MRIVVVFGMGESFRSIWTHNRPWIIHTDVDHAQQTASFHTPHAAYAHSQEKTKARIWRVAETGRGRGTWFFLTARVTRGGSCGKVGEVERPVYAEI